MLARRSSLGKRTQVEEQNLLHPWRVGSAIFRMQVAEGCALSCPELNYVVMDCIALSYPVLNCDVMYCTIMSSTKL